VFDRLIHKPVRPESAEIKWRHPHDAGTDRASSEWATVYGKIVESILCPPELRGVFEETLLEALSSIEDVVPQELGQIEISAGQGWEDMLTISLPSCITAVFDSS
jgi:hypothetical protein